MTLLPHKMDNAIDDVVVLVENQYEITEGTSRKITSGYFSIYQPVQPLAIWDLQQVRKNNDHFW
jgi:hypothetical protein